MVSPDVADRVKKGDFVASVVDIFGFLCDEYYAPEDGVIVGKATNPSNFQGIFLKEILSLCAFILFFSFYNSCMRKSSRILWTIF